MHLALKSYLQLLAHVLLPCVGCRVMSLIIVKLKLQMCKFRKEVLVCKIEYHMVFNFTYQEHTKNMC